MEDKSVVSARQERSRRILALRGSGAARAGASGRRPQVAGRLRRSGRGERQRDRCCSPRPRLRLRVRLGFVREPGFHFSDYFWIPIVGPLIGGIIGVIIYDLFVGDVLHARLKMQEQVEGPIEETRLPEGTQADA